MVYDLIAAFYCNANDSEPRYRVPVNVLCADSADELLGKGFHEDSNSTPGYTDYIREVTEEELEEFANAECADEVIPVLDGADYGLIVLHAYELETMAGEILPRAIYIGDNSAHFTGIEEDDMVIFRHDGRGFARGINAMKQKFSVITMFEVMDIVREFFEGNPSEEEVREKFGSGLDDAIRLASCKFHGMLDLDGNPAILHALEVGRMGNTIDEQIAGYLHDVVEDTDTNLDDLEKMGFTHRVIDAVGLLTREDSDCYEDYIMRILNSGSEIAINVKINDLRHNIQRGHITLEKARQAQLTDMCNDIMSINRRHEDALALLTSERALDPAFQGMNQQKYRYFKGEKLCPFEDKVRRVFWQWERMYCMNFELPGREELWQDGAEDLLRRFRNDDLPDDNRIGRLVSYTKDTLAVFCYIAAMKGKWFPMDEDDWELDY